MPVLHRLIPDRVAVTNARIKYLKENASAYMCKTCYISFNTNQHLKSHVSSAYVKVYEFNCLICSHLTYVSSQMHNHLVRLHGYEGDEITRFSLLAICEQLCNSETQTQPAYNCIEDRCMEEFKGPYKLLMHKLSHTSAKFTCRPCNKLHASFSSLSAHVQLEHPGFKVYICGVGGCPKFFESFANLQRHLATSFEHSETSYECFKCRMKLASPDSLRTHLRLPVCPSLKIYKYRCDNCPRKYSYFRNYDKHIKLCSLDMLNVRQLTVTSKKMLNNS